MFKAGDIVIRKDSEPKHQFVVTLVDNEWNMDIKILYTFDLMGRFIGTPYSIDTEYRVAQKDWEYEEYFERTLKLKKIKEKCVR